MTADFVGRAMRRADLRLFAFSVVGLVIVIVVAVASSNYYYNFFNGPFLTSREQLLGLSDVDGLREYYVTVQGDEGFDTGYERTTTTRNRRTGSTSVSSTYFHALRLGDRLLLVLSDHSDPGAQYTGTLGSLGQDDRQVVRTVENETPGLAGAFLSYRLYEGDNTRSLGLVGLGAGGLIGLASLWGLVRVLLRRTDPLKHPIMRKLARFGDARAAAQQINAELNGDSLAIGTVRFTPNWVVQTNWAYWNATRLDDVVWVYKHVTQHRAKGIPVGKAFNALIYDRHGTCVNFIGKEEQVDQAIGGLVQRAPWIVAGYTPQIQQAWAKDRATFIAAVDQRRKQSSNVQR